MRAGQKGYVTEIRFSGATGLFNFDFSHLMKLSLLEIKKSSHRCIFIIKYTNWKIPQPQDKTLYNKNCVMYFFFDKLFNIYICSSPLKIQTLIKENQNNRWWIDQWDPHEEGPNFYEFFQPVRMNFWVRHTQKRGSS
jgi:hypothetical protein